MVRIKNKFNKDWVVRVYKNSSLIDSWKILNRFEWEAAKEAESDIERLGNKGNDWTLMPLNWREE